MFFCPYGQKKKVEEEREEEDSLKWSVREFSLRFLSVKEPSIVFRIVSKNLLSPKESSKFEENFL